MNSKERAELKSKANGLKPLFQIGKDGMSEAFLAQTSDALDARELIKIKVLLSSSPVTPRAVADEICEKLHAECVGVIGGVVILFRKSEKLAEKKALKEKNIKQAKKRAREKYLSQKAESKKKFRK